MSAKKLYERLVGKMMSHWQSLYPMAEWRDPEGAMDRIVEELLELRGKRYVRSRANWSEVKPRRLFDDEVPNGYMESDRDFVANNFTACVEWLEARTK